MAAPDRGIGDPNGYIWFGGPSGAIIGQPTPTFILPEGSHEIQCYYDDGSTLNYQGLFSLAVGGCFSISATGGRGKVLLEIPVVENTERFDIYRSEQNSPRSFQMIAQVTAGTKTIKYTDSTVQNDTAYLYVVAANSEGTTIYSSIECALPTALKTDQIPNYPPLIYSSPKTAASVGYEYKYLLKVKDPNNNPIILSLIDAPQGMTSDTYELQWTPDSEGTFPVTVNVSDGQGGNTTQSFNIEVGKVTLPVSVDISADPASVVPGSSTTLSWTTTYATSVAIDNDIGTKPPNSSVEVDVNETTTFTITASAFGNTATDSVTVSTAPVVSFQATPQNISSGETSYLTWTTANADTVSIAQGIGDVALSSTGEGIAVSPAGTTTYTLTASNSGGTATQQVTVTVLQPPSINFSANPQSVLSGESSTLSWTSSNADTVSIDNGIGDVALNDSLTATPSVTTTYTITATGPGGTSTDQVTVTVIPLPTVNFTATPNSITLGESATLTWSTSNADSVTIDQGIGIVALNDSTIVSPTETTTYTITVSGPGGTIIDQIQVDVIIPGINITEPTDLEVIQRKDTIVKGTIDAGVGSFNGIRVNGVYAIIDGNTFVANHVPLESGDNTITAIIYLPDGQTYQDGITVSAEPDNKQASIQCAGLEGGLAPMEITLQAESNFSFSENPIFSYSGPGAISFLPQTEPTNITGTITVPGVYYFSVSIKDSEGQPYTDEIAVEIMDSSQADAMLRSQWEGMKTALAAGDINQGLTYFIERSRDKYQVLIQEVTDLPGFVNSMEDIEMIYFENDIAKYRIHRTEDVGGTPTSITYYIYFTRDTDGKYKIYKF